MRLSLTLSLYIMRQFLLSVLLVFCVFGTFIFLVNVLELIKRTHDQNVPFAMILQMALLKLPQVGQKALPFTVLLGTVLTYTRFTRTQELTVMRSAGVSVWQFLMPALLSAFTLGALVIFVLNPLSCVMLTRFERLENKYLHGRNSFVDISADGIWLRQKTYTNGRVKSETILHAQRSGSLDNIEISDAVIFVFAITENAEGKRNYRFVQRIDAKQGSLMNGFWRLGNVILTDTKSAARHHNEYFLPTDLTVKDINNSFATPDTISFWALPHFISMLKKSGFSALSHRLHWHTILISPLFFMAMVCFGALFSLRPVRQGKTGLLITASILSGFLIYFLTNLVSSLGLSGTMPVVLAAWAPVAVCMLAGVGFLMHFEDG